LIHASTTLIKSKLYQKPYYGLIGLPMGRVLDRRLNLTAKSGISLTTISKSDTAIISDRIANFHSSIEQQRRNATYLLSSLSMKNCVLPGVPADRESNHYQFPVRFKTREHRDMAADYFLRRGIDCAKYLDEIVDYTKATCGYDGDCRNAELCSKTTLLLPHYYTLSLDTLAILKRTLIEIDPLLK
jgi:dTDP-4-amino-4,6-dideoxygalactose transaminase